MKYARVIRLEIQTTIRSRKSTSLFRQPALSQARGLLVVIFVSTLLSSGSLSAQELTASDRRAEDEFGLSISLSGSTGFVGAIGDDDDGLESGSAYIFHGLNTATGAVNESVKLTVSDAAAGDGFGRISLFGNMGLAGANGDDDNGFNSGSAYVFRGLNSATGTVNESVKLTASDGAAGDQFGRAVSLSGNTGLVGARYDRDNGLYSGSAYVFRGLDTATGTVNESVKLIASDGAVDDGFGGSVSLSGIMSLVGAEYDDDTGSAYVFRGLDTATGTVNESVKLTASDETDQFGASLSLSGNTGLVGAFRGDSGSAYVFRGLDTATGTINESVKLTASDGAANDWFGASVSLSGNTGLVGAALDDDNADRSGSAYVFRGLDTASGTANESVKLTASDAAGLHRFGSSVSLDGDRFLIGARFRNRSGIAYTGTVSSMTTLDLGNTSLIVDAISFESRTDWIIGETTSSNHVTLTQGDTGKVVESGAGIYIGANAGSNQNSLTIAGNLEANKVTVGAEVNLGNSLILDATSSHATGDITLFENNSLLLQGDFTSFSQLDEQLGMTDLFVSINGEVQLINQTSFNTLLLTNFDSGYTSFTAIAQPVLLGDLNLDGVVNFLDIPPFISVLSGGGYQAEADIDQNGTVNFLDLFRLVFILILSFIFNVPQFWTMSLTF